MLLTPDQEMIRDAVRAFAQEQLWPHAARWDKEHHFPHDAHRGLAALGAYGICVPEEFGGADLDYVTLALVLEEIAAGDGGTSTAISVTNCPVNAILMRYGNAAQKKRWLTPLAQGRDAGRVLPDRAARGQRRLGAADHRSARRRRLRPQWRQAVHHQRPERAAGDRHRRHRQGRGQEGHERLPGAHRCARLCGGAAGRQDRPAFQRHRADQFRQLPHSRRSPDRRGRRGLQDRLVGTGGRAHRHRRPVGRHGAQRLRGGAGVRQGARRASAPPSSIIRRSASAWPTARPNWKPRVN